ncbi:MAG: Na+/H+ antiporter subunit G [Burkholderiales bacterium]
MRAAIEVLISLLLVAGGFFGLVGAIGLVRLPDFLMRLHAPTKATTLGVGGALLAALLYFVGSGRWIVHELLIAAFLFIGAPVSALMLAQAAIRARLPSRAPLAEAGEDEERPG